MAGVVLIVVSVMLGAPAFAAAQGPASTWAADLLLDHRARHVGDLVTVQITESITAVGTADANTGKASKSDGALPWPIPSSWSRFMQSSSNTSFTGTGTTSRAASITAMMTVRVMQRLPNGDLVVEGVREIVINGDRQFITLTGVIRPSDISLGNLASSASVGDLRIQYYGKGFMKDNLSPSWLVRILNKIF
jgi:flagellar L-ring protein precursor FlgH